MVESGATHLRLPVYFDASRPCVTPFGGDWRTREGELLAPIRYPREAVERLKGTELKADGSVRAGMSPADFEAQYQQDPHPERGGIFPREALERKDRRWHTLPSGMHMVISVDAAFKDNRDSDYCAAQVWGRHGADFYLVDQIHDQLDVFGVCGAILALRRKWSRARTILVEDKANGPAVIQILRSRVPGLIAVNPLGGKVVRARSTRGYWASGNVWLPASAPWLSGFVTEHVRFPRAKKDDQVDAGTQAMIYLEGDNSGHVLKLAMQRVRASY